VALFAFWGISTNCVQNVSKILGLDASDGIAEIVLGHDVVPVEHGSGAVTRHAHYHGLWNAKPARPGDEAAAQIVEPDPVKPCRFRARRKALLMSCQASPVRGLRKRGVVGSPRGRA